MNEQKKVGTFSLEELEGQIAAIEHIYLLVYSLAQAAELPRVIAFAAWLHEYLMICRAALAEGVDFAHVEPTLHYSNALYCGEKLRAVYGEQLGGNPDLLASLLFGLFGGRSEKPLDKDLAQQVWEHVCRFVVAVQARQAATDAPSAATPPE